MGSYSSSFTEEGAVELAETGTHPSKADWITSHALVSGLAIVEVERLWERFQQLGCNEDGVLEMEVLYRPPASNDIFAKNIILHLVGDNRRIEFRTFLNAVVWAEKANIHDKIKGIFQLINHGDPVSHSVLFLVLRKTYPHDSEEEIRKLTDVIMKQVDINNTGFMSEDEFYRWVCETPKEIVNEILQFKIVPSEAAAETAMAHANIPTDDMLQQVADSVHTRQWHRLANKLGFIQSELRPFEQAHKSNTRAQVLAMLKAWRSKLGVHAYTTELEKALRQAGMNDVAVQLSKH